MLDNLNDIGDRIRESMEEKTRVRDAALLRSRELIRYCANAIRAVHRHEFEEAQTLLNKAQESAGIMIQGVDSHSDLYNAGYTQDALKELAEAHLTYALVRGLPLPAPEELGVRDAAYLNGLGEAVGELRRYALDSLRRDEVVESERILEAMDDIYSLLVTMDFPDAITRGLRRTTDVTRGILERTRGDLTLSLRQERLRRALHDFEERMNARLDGNGEE
jgi:translin